LGAVARSPRAAIAAATAVNLGAYFVLSKFVAVRSGVAGIAVLGVVSAISNIFALLADANVGPELTKRVAARRPGAAGDEDVAVVTRAVFRITAVGCVGLLVVLAALAPWLGSWLDLSVWAVIAAGAAGVATIAVQQCFNFLSGVGATGRVAAGGIARSLAVTGVIVLTMVVLDSSLPFAYLFGMAAGAAATVAFTVGVLPRLRGSAPRGLVGGLLRVGGGMTATLVAYTGALFALPLMVQAVAGTETNGLFKAAALVSGGLLQFLNSTIRYEFFPRISAAPSAEDADRAVRAELRLLVAAMGCMAVVMVALRMVVWPVLLTGDFDGASGVLVWVLVGDLLRVFVTVIGFGLYARIGVRWLLALEAVNGAALVALVWFAAAHDATPTAVGVAYAGAHLVAVVAAALFASRRLVGRPLWLELGLLAMCAALVAVTALASDRSTWLGIALAVVSVAVLGNLVLAARRQGRSAPNQPWVTAGAMRYSDVVPPRGLGLRHGIVLGGITVLSTATQLRSAGGVGPAEVLLVLFLAATWRASGLVTRWWAPSRVTRALLVFAVMSTAGALMGSLVFDEDLLAMVLGLSVPVLLLVVVCYAMTRPDPARLLKPWALTFGLGFLATQSMLLVASRVTGSVGPFVPMYFDIRFQGWTTNPNQLAFLTAVACGAVLVSGVRSVVVRVAAVVAALGIGAASLSDGFRLALMVGVMALLLLSVTSAARRAAPLARLCSWVAIALGGVGVALLWPRLLSRAEGVASAGNQGSDRMSLWKACVHAIGQSPLTGLGPGGHASLPTVAEPMECHNSLLDVSSSAGLIAGAVFVLLIVALIGRAWRRLDRVAVFVLVQLSVMTMFGYLLRYPPLWLLLALIEVRLFPCRRRQSRGGSSFRKGEPVLATPGVDR
jgi:O-antigen ligase